MNIKNMMFAFMFTTAFFSSFAVAGGVPPMDLQLEKVGVVLATGSAGAGAMGAFGAYKGAALGATYGAMLGGVAGPIGFVVGGAAGVIVGGAAGAATGYVGLVVTKALYNEFKKR